MDEFTSAIDQETEEKIFDNFIKKYPKQTLIMIAHRKSIIDKCDVVLKLKIKILSKLNKMIAIIQARCNSKRFRNKVLKFF